MGRMANGCIQLKHDRGGMQFSPSVPHRAHGMAWMWCTQAACSTPHHTTPPPSHTSNHVGQLELGPEINDTKDICLTGWLHNLTPMPSTPQQVPCLYTNAMNRITQVDIHPATPAIPWHGRHPSLPAATPFSPQNGMAAHTSHPHTSYAHTHTHAHAASCAHPLGRCRPLQTAERCVRRAPPAWRLKTL